MLILGLIYLLQASFLPGFLFYNFLKRDKYISEAIPISFGLSLIFNYILIYALSILGIYTYSIIISVFISEILLLTFLAIKQKSNFIFQTSIFHIFILILLFLINQNIFKTESIMNGEDQIYSWNQWALEWANNSLPSITKNYPQLLPINWSISYILIKNNSVQFFAKTIMPLFFMNIILNISFFLFLNKLSILFNRIESLLSRSFIEDKGGSCDCWLNSSSWWQQGY